MYVTKGFSACLAVVSEGLLVIVARCHSDVTHQENYKNDRLDHADDRSQRVERQRHDKARQPSENAEHGVVGEHVGVKTNAERERTDQVVNELDRKHQNCQRQVWAEKTLQIPDTLRGEALVDVVAEADGAEREGEVGVGGWRLHPRYQSEEVGEQDEHEDASEERDHRARSVHLGDYRDEIVEPFDDHLGTERTLIPSSGITGSAALCNRGARDESAADQNNDRFPSVADETLL